MTQDAAARRPPVPPPLLLLVGLVACGPMSTDLYLPSLPSLTRVFATDVPQVQLTLSVFITGFAVAQLILGPLSDRFGRRPVLLGGFALFFAASIGCTLAPSIEALILGRFLQALGACAGPVVGRAIVRDVYPRDEAARVLSSMASAMALAPAVAPFLGGALQAAFGWRSNFAALVVFSLALLVLGWRILEETNHHPDRNALSPAAMLETYVTLLKDRSFLLSTLTLSFAFGAMFSFISGSSFVIIDLLGLAPQNFGFCFLAVVAGYMLGSFAAARLTRRIGLERMIGIGTLVGVVAGVVLLGLAAARVQTVIAVVLPVAGIFMANGLVLPNGTAAALAPHPRIAGSASALLGFIQMGFGAAAGRLVGLFYDGTTLPMAAVMAAMLVGAALCHRLK